jgi:hypothetical protein
LRVRETRSGRGRSRIVGGRPPGGLAHPVLFAKESTSRPVSRVLSGCPSREGRPRRPFIWGAGCPAPRATNPGGGPEDGLRVPGVPARRPPLFGLAPGGVYRAAPVARRAVRSYRTVSPLPARPRPGPAVCSLWHCPWGRPRRPLAATVSPWSPDFPPPEDRSRAPPAAAVRPAGPAHKGARAPRVKIRPVALDHDPMRSEAANSQEQPRQAAC